MEYIDTAKLEILRREPFIEAGGNQVLLYHFMDNVGQRAMMYSPIGTFRNFNAEEGIVNTDHWGNIASYIGKIGNWMSLGAQFRRDTMNGIPTIPKQKIRLLYSVFHYLLDMTSETSKDSRKAIERMFEICDLGPIMTERELLTNVKQIEALGNIKIPEK